VALEGDTIIDNAHKQSILTHSERNNVFAVLSKVSNHLADEVEQAIEDMLNHLYYLAQNLTNTIARGLPTITAKISPLK
jgi:IS30 family transposase